MAVENVNILMRLVSVDEIRFMMSSGEMVDMPGPDDLQIGFMNQVQLDEVDKDRISIAFGVRYELKKEPRQLYHQASDAAPAQRRSWNHARHSGSEDGRDQPVKLSSSYY